MKKYLLTVIALLVIVVGCASRSGIKAPDWYLNPPQDEEHIYGAATASSQSLQISLDKAKQDARLSIAEELESNIMGLVKKFDEEVGGAEDSELLQQFTQVSKNVVDKTLVGSRISKSKVEKEDGVYRAFVLMEIPLGDARAKLLDQLSSNKHLYTRFRASQSFQELKEEIDKLREFKKEQGY